MAEESNKTKGRIQSIERAFSILEETATHQDGITLSDLSRNLGLHTSTLYHLIKTLVDLGYLRQMDNSKRYRVGRAVYSLASACSDEAEYSDIATPFLEELARTTGESTHFAIWERGEVLILARALGSNAFQMNERPGMLRPIYCTAIGKALLSGLSDEEFWARTDGLEFKPYTSSTLAGPQELMLHVNKVRSEGIAYDDCEYNAETRCAAAPVRDFHGGVMGAIGFSGPVWRLSLTDMAKHVPVTIEAAEKLSEALGFVRSENMDDNLHKSAG